MVYSHVTLVVHGRVNLYIFALQPSRRRTYARPAVTDTGPPTARRHSPTHSLQSFLTILPNRSHTVPGLDSQPMSPCSSLMFRPLNSVEVHSPETTLPTESSAVKSHTVSGLDSQSMSACSPLKFLPLNSVEVHNPETTLQTESPVVNTTHSKVEYVSFQDFRFTVLLLFAYTHNL